MKRLKLFGAGALAAMTVSFMANAGSGTFDVARGEPKTKDTGEGRVTTDCAAKDDNCAIVYTASDGRKYFRPLDRFDGIWYEVTSAPMAPVEDLFRMFATSGVEGVATALAIEP